MASSLPKDDSIIIFDIIIDIDLIDISFPVRHSMQLRDKLKNAYHYDQTAINKKILNDYVTENMEFLAMIYSIPPPIEFDPESYIKNIFESRNVYSNYVMLAHLLSDAEGKSKESNEFIILKEFFYRFSTLKISKPMKKIKAGGIIRIKNLDKYVVVESYFNNIFGPPKGSVDVGENTLNGALREIREEIMIKLKLLDKPTDKNIINHRGIIFYLFELESWKGIYYNKEYEGEITMIKLVSKNDESMDKFTFEDKEFIKCDYDLSIDDEGLIIDEDGYETVDALTPSELTRGYSHSPRSRMSQASSSPSILQGGNISNLFEKYYKKYNK